MPLPIEPAAFKYLVYRAKLRNLTKEIWLCAAIWQKFVNGRFVWSPCYNTLATHLGCSRKQISRLFQHFTKLGWVSPHGTSPIYRCFDWELHWDKIAAIAERFEDAQKNRRLSKAKRAHTLNVLKGIAGTRTPPMGLDTVSNKTKEILLKAELEEADAGFMASPSLQPGLRPVFGSMSHKNLEHDSEESFNPEQDLETASPTQPDSAASRSEAFQASSDQPEFQDSSESNQERLNMKKDYGPGYYGPITNSEQQAIGKKLIQSRRLPQTGDITFDAVLLFFQDQGIGATTFSEGVAQLHGPFLNHEYIIRLDDAIITLNLVEADIPFYGPRHKPRQRGSQASIKFVREEQEFDLTDPHSFDNMLAWIKTQETDSP